MAEATTPQETNSLNQNPNQQPSPLSSPSHEFSFTITLHPTPNSSPNTSITHNNNDSFDLDLAPADNIFCHGHLLPLNLLSHPPVSPRPSTDVAIQDYSFNPHLQLHNHMISPDENKSKKPSNSLCKISKWFEDKKKYLLKKYASMVEPLLSSKGERVKRDLRRRPYSSSGNSNNPKERDKWMRRRREFSAPASMRTSPTNSGLLVTAPAGYSSLSESSMEELQNAIQAAIAHCKNSTATAKVRVQVRKTIW